MEIDANLKKLYEKRFKGELRRKNDIWKILCDSFFQNYVRETDIVLDIGAGYCEFINNIKCAQKYAVDLNEDSHKFAASSVRVHTSPSTDLSFLQEASVDVVFISNFLEHLKNKADVLNTLTEVFRVLKMEGGKLMILQPNIRYAYKEYWDFFDHHLALSDKSLIEALQIAGFSIERVLPKFLPYTTKTKMPQKEFLIKAYLKFPLIWKILGKQMLIIARKKQKEHSDIQS